VNMLKISTFSVKRFCPSLLLAVACVVTNPNAWADDEQLDSWPSRPVTIIAGNRVGGVFDIMARGLAKHLSPVLGVPVVVQNISGATTKAANYLLRQPDDGYTYLVTAPVPFMVWSMAHKDVNFTLDDFAIINNQTAWLG